MTDVEICNLALTKLGCNTIDTLGDNSPEAAQCRSNLTAAKNAVLEAAAWTFNKKQLLLTEDPVPPLFSYTHAWIIPQNVLTVYMCCQSDGLPLNFPWERQGNRILTQDTPVYATVGLRVTDTNTMPASFIEALAYYLAEKMCNALTENRNLRDDLVAEYREALDVAKYIDGKQGTMQKLRAIRIPGRIL